MVITATELKINMGKYLDLASREDIFITKNGKNIAKLTSPEIDKMALLESLVGVSKPQEAIDDSYEEKMKIERLERQ